MLANIKDRRQFLLAPGRGNLLTECGAGALAAARPPPKFGVGICILALGLVISAGAGITGVGADEGVDIVA